MSSNLPAGPEGGIPEWIANLKHIPALSAIGRLVGGAASAGAAWIDIVAAAGEERAQTIRDRKDARSTLTKEAVQVAAQQMNNDPELAGRALDHVLGASYRAQENREAVAKLTVEQLTADPLADSASETPSDDWMNVFEAHAEKASSDRLRQHWARILSGEIRKPGSFSLQTLQFMSILDSGLAATVERIAIRVVGSEMIIQDKATKQGQLFMDLVDLEALGLVKLDLGRTFESGDDGWFFLRLGLYGLLFNLEPHQDHTFPSSYLTRSGREVMSIVNPKPNLDLVRELGKEIAEDRKFKKVTLVQVSKELADGIEYAIVEVLVDRIQTPAT